MDSQQLKIEAAKSALSFVYDGIKLGIGTGSTADEFVKLLAPKVADGLKIEAVATSERTERLCQELGIQTQTLQEVPVLDLTIDGTDEFDPHLQLIKGAGGALLREKIVAKSSKSMIVIADASKRVAQLGSNFALPIEVVPFGISSTIAAIKALALQLKLSDEMVIRKQEDGSDYITDGNHFIVDASFGRIFDAKQLNHSLNQIPGVVENGLFIDIAQKAIIAEPDGVQIIEPI